MTIDSCRKDSGPIVLSRHITISQMNSFKTEEICIFTDILGQGSLTINSGLPAAVSLMLCLCFSGESMEGMRGWDRAKQQYQIIASVFLYF